MSLFGAITLLSWFGVSLAGFASPVDAKPCPTLTLGPGLVSPGTGTVTTSYRFSVTVVDKSGTAPSWVRLRVNGTSIDLSPSGANFKAGVVFSGARTLPVGRWPYSFSVRSGGATCTFAGVVPAAVVVAAPKPTPKPTAKPTPKPTARPTPKPTARPTPRATAKPTAKPTPKPVKATPKPTPKPGSTKTPRPTATSTPTPASSPSAVAASVAPTSTPSASPTPRPVTGGAAGGGSDGGGFDPQLTIDAPGLVAGVTNPLVAWLVTTVGGVLLFLFLVRRPRKDDDSPSVGLVLAAEPRSAGPAHGSAVRPPQAYSPAAAPAATSGPPRAPRTFDAPPAKDAERVKVGYRRVRISSKPDAVRSVELGRLEQGDEVEILESYEGFLRVETADGITGWIQRHTVVGGTQG